MLLRFSGLLFGLAIALSGHAEAQDPESPPYFNRGDVQRAITRALSAIHTVKCGKAPCAKATTEEFTSPPIDVDEARIALLAGATSARLKWCGLEWKQRAYPLMMQQFQLRGIHDARKLELLNLIHNAQFGRDYAQLQALKTCPEALRASLDKRNPVIDLPPWQRILNNALLDQSVAQMVQRALSEIHQARCGPDKCPASADGTDRSKCEPQLCSPATEAEKANPPITIEQARRAMQIGLMSGVAAFCAIDWRRRIFIPFITYQRRKLAMSERQIAIVAMLHGTMQSFMLKNYREHEKSCTDKMRNGIEKQLSKR